LSLTKAGSSFQDLQLQHAAHSFQVTENKAFRAEVKLGGEYLFYTDRAFFYMDASHTFRALLDEQPQGSSCFSQSGRDYAASAKINPRGQGVTLPILVH